MSEEFSPAAPQASTEDGLSDAEVERSALLDRARAKARARRDAALIGRPRGAALLISPPEIPAPEPVVEPPASEGPPERGASPSSAEVPAVRRSPLADPLPPSGFRPDPPAGASGETGPAAPRTLAGPTSSASGPPSSASPSALTALSARGAGARRVGDRVAALEKGAPPWSAAAQLSPRMTAVFGAIFGLATVTTVIALLIQSVPPRDDRGTVAAALGSAAPIAEGGEPAPGDAGPTKPAKRVRTKIPGPWRLAELEKDPAIKIISQEMERRAFVTALQDAGVEKAQVYRILKAFEGQRKFDKCGRKDRFSVAIEKASKTVVAFEYAISPLEVYQARANDQNLLVAAQLDMKVGEEEVTGAFYVAKSLARSIEWSPFEPGIDSALDDAFEGHTTTDGFEEGGTVRVIAMERTALGDFAGYDAVVAAEYRPADPSKPPERIYSFKGSKSKGYFDERGRQPDGGGWNHAVPGAPITSRFNPKRLHPILKKIMPHNGTDYGAPSGTPVYAVYRGEITWVGPKGPAGNLIQIQHPGGIETGYYHLSRFAEGIKVGKKVAGQQLIGYVGTTGRSTGPHLHLAAKRDGKYFDSETLRMGSFRVVDVDDRTAFLARKTELDARLDAIPLPEPPPAEPAAAAVAEGDGRPPGDEGDPDAAEPGTSAPAKQGNGKPEEPASKPTAKVDDAPDGDLEDLVGPDLR